jgi:hypothetical protein
LPAKIEELNISLASLRIENEKLLTKAKELDVCNAKIEELNISLASLKIEELNISLHVWYNLHSYVLYQRGESSFKGSNDSIFGNLCQRGREHEPKAKGPHHHQFQNFSLSIWF